MTKLVYLTGANYSGTTLLTFLLNTHPDIATIGELKGSSKDPATHACSCGQAIGVCPFWSEILEKLHQRGNPFCHEDVHTQCGFRIPNASFLNRVANHRLRGWPLELARDMLLNLHPYTRREMTRIARTNQDFIEVVHEITCCKVFLDSSKDVIRLKHLMRSQPFPILVIHMYRDGRGVMNSTMKRRKLSPEIAALDWKVREVEIGRILRHFPADRKTTICYEDLCQDPQTQLTRIYQFLGLSPSDGHCDFRSAPNHILGNKMRLTGSSEIALDTKWYSELTPAALKTFERVAGDVNRRLGYSSEFPTTPVAE
jgi:hypothetical protein